MKIENKALREAYALLENAAPAGSADCGAVCGAVCCTDKNGDGMELFPYEKELLEAVEGFEITDGDIAILSCKGVCERKLRPLACRMYPLFPLVVNEGGEEKIRVIYDPRAAAACPLAEKRVRLDRHFVRAVRRAGKYLLRDEKTALHLRNTSEYLTELIELEIKLNS